MSWHLNWVYAVAVLAASVATGCAPVPPLSVEQTPAVHPQAAAQSAPEVAVTEEMLVGAAWQLQALPGMPVLQAPLPSVQFLGLQQVQGSDGCNRFAAHVRVSAQSVRFTGLRATLMACLPAAPGQEDRFFLALERTRSMRLHAGRLHLLDQDGQVLAEFRR